MALSQNVVINFLTKFDKKGLQRATKELKGFDKVIASSKFATKAALVTAGIASAYALDRFARSSVRAALDQERLDKSLNLTLASIGQSGLTGEVSAFIQSLQATTNVTEDALVPAFQQLVTQTGDVQSAQELLKLSLDASAGTGKDLATVLDAVTKAAVGNFKGIGALGVGVTAAEAKALGFAKSIQLLTKYEGAAEASTLTLDGQMQAFKISAGEATETLGTGFLTAFAIISEGQPLIKNLGTDLETAARQFSNIFVGLATVLKEKGLSVYADLAKIFVEGLVGESGTLQRLEKTGIKALSTERLTANEREDRLKATKKILTFDQIIANIQKNILASTKLTTKEKQAQEALDKKKAELSAMFDIDRINLQAALSRKLSAEDEIRVKILQRLTDGTKAAVDEAQRYADVLKVIQDGKLSTEDIQTLASKWNMTTTAVELYLKRLFEANSELQKMLGLLNQPATVAPTSAGKYPESFNKDLIDAFGLFSGISVAGLNNMPQLAEGGVVSRPTIAMIGEAGAEAVIPLDRMGSMDTKVVVNVQGSVISEGQLQSVIQDVLYNLNRTGAVTQLANLGR